MDEVAFWRCRAADHSISSYVFTLKPSKWLRWWPLMGVVSGSIPSPCAAQIYFLKRFLGWPFTLHEGHSRDSRDVNLGFEFFFF